MPYVSYPIPLCVIKKMSLLNRIFGKKKKEPKENSMGNYNSKIPVNQSLEFLTHQETLYKEFDFLISEFGFEKKIDDWFRREFTTVFSKENIEIRIIFEPLSLPFVSIKNTNLPYDESNNLTNSDIIEDFNIKVREIKSENRNRTATIRKNYMQKWVNDKELDLSELEKDYVDYGNKEHIELLIESAKTIRENLTKGKGVLKNATQHRV
jgi:hypothetical protein